MKLKYSKEPIQKCKIVMDNYMGRGYGGNCKYIADYLLRKYPGVFDIVWLSTRRVIEEEKFPQGIRVIEYNSKEALKEYYTAKVWVSNYHKVSTIKKGLRKRKGQVFIETWHGSLGIKKIENDVPGLIADRNWEKLAKFSSEMVDFWISNSTFETNVYKSAFWEATEILEFGHPRNDIFWQDLEKSRRSVFEFYNIDLSKRVLLYAPTFREDYRLDCYSVDFTKIVKCFSSKFGGDWIVLCRLHPRVMKYAPDLYQYNEKIMDATRYPDIQELLVASDAMISDYSSCIFDFVLSRKPGFIYATDFAEYNNERGFYYSLEETPFPIATNNKELENAIINFNKEEYIKKVELFLKGKRCIEDGHASERVADLIKKICFEEETTHL